MFATQARFGVHTRTVTPIPPLGVTPGTGLEPGLGLGLESRTTDDGSGRWKTEAGGWKARAERGSEKIDERRFTRDERRDERLTAERTDDASEPRLSLDASTGGSELETKDVWWGGGVEARVCASVGMASACRGPLERSGTGTGRIAIIKSVESSPGEAEAAGWSKGKNDAESSAQLRGSSLSVLGTMKICCHLGLAEATLGMMATNLL